MALLIKICDSYVFLKACVTLLMRPSPVARPLRKSPLRMLVLMLDYMYSTNVEG